MFWNKRPKPTKSPEASLPIAANDLEGALFGTIEGRMSMDAFLDVLVRSQVAVPSKAGVLDNGQGLDPLFFDRNGIAMAAVFTDISRVMPEHSTQAPFCLQVRADWLIKGMQPDCGLVLFAAPGKGCELSPQALQELRDRL